MSSRIFQHQGVLDAHPGHGVLPALDGPRAAMAPGESAAGSYVDEAEMLRRVDGDVALLDEIAELFEAERHTMFQAIERAAAEADARALQREAHKLRGALLHLAARPAADAAHFVEQCGRTSSVVPPERLRDLALELDGVSTALSSLRPKTLRP